MDNKIREFVYEAVRKKARLTGVDIVIDGGLSLTAIGLLDSMEFFGLITDIEEKYNVIIDFESVNPDHFTTIDGLVSCARKK